jgi:serine/threonine-protein kinase
VRTFGKYTLLAPLASGGMADVFRAETAGAAGVTKEVALKLVRGEHGADDAFVRMFIQEARLASRLTHANVVQVFEFDAVEGRYYIAMELVRGRNLARVVERCRELGVRLGLPRAVHVAAEAAKGLAYAHRLAGPDGKPLCVVHRDVSPQNLLISFEGEVKVADFGIARAIGQAGVTAPGTIKGKLAYMAPEQARGEAVDARADVFSLGVVLWELCTGRRLFARDSEAATIAAVLSGEPISPPSAWNEEVPPELDAVALAALERDPGRRTPTAEELAQALGRVLLRAAEGPEDWDLRTLMHRLWPEGDAPPAAAEATRVRPAAPAASAGLADADAPTRTAPAPARASHRRRRMLGVLAAVAATGALAVVAVVRGGAREPPQPQLPPVVAAAGPPAITPPAPAPPAAAPRPVPSAGRDAPPPTPAPEAGSIAARPREHAVRPGLRSLPAPPARSGEGVVAVESNPWAFVAVDGFRLQGETPLSVQLPAGRHRIRLEHAGVRPMEFEIEVRAGARLEVRKDLQR